MICYIILHYKNINETLECLDNLNKIKGKTSKIIIVDNNSLEKAEEKILRNYTKDIIKLDKNYGFAKANNIGVKYAKEKYNCDYYVVMNNDVYIYQNDFEKKIINSYKLYNFDMLGPKILSPTGESVNPFHVYKDRKKVENEITRTKKLIRIYNNYFLYLLLSLYIKLKHLFKKPIKCENGKKLQKNIALHGCCIIFSKKYFNKINNAFYNETFLFHEEEFLYQIMIKNKLISIYNPELEIFHKEGSSVKKNNNSIRKSKLFREYERLKSLELLLEYIDN